mgnify:CR=1 FL=1
MAPRFFSIHKISTTWFPLGLLVLVALPGSCTRDSGHPPKDSGAVPPVEPKSAKPEEETVAQQSHRLRPRLEVCAPGEGGEAQMMSPLLGLAKDTPLRARIVLGYGGTEKLPTSKQLRDFEALGMPLWKRISGNLADLQSKEPRILPEVIVVDNRRVTGFRVPVDRPGAEALILMPELWDAFMKYEKPLVAALPSRNDLYFIIDEPDNLKTWGMALQEVMKKASDPMVGRFLRRKDGMLVPDQTFEEAAKD